MSNAVTLQSNDIITFKSVDFTEQPVHGLTKKARNAEWCRLYRDEGKTAQEIGDAFGVTRERVCQVLRRFNLIEHRIQRRALAKELIEQDRAAVKADKEARDLQLIELVRAGDSIATAAGKVGLTVPVACWACKKHGVQSGHGRWRDFTERKARLTELVNSGLSLSAAVIQRSQEEGQVIGYLWVHRNTPELLPKNRPRVRIYVDAPHAPPPEPIPVPPIVDPESYWTEDRTKKLLELWFGGTSAQQTADILGDCSRNAVLGKLHRLRLAGKLVRPA